MWLFRLHSVFLVGLLLVASCGFQLRGTATVPPQMARTYIDTADRHSLFYRELRRELINAGVDIVDAPDSASAVFRVISDETGQRVLSVSARNVPREFEVFYTVFYAVDSGQASLLAPRTQTLTRDYTWDETLVLGKEQEERLLREAIVSDLVRIVMIQLSSI